MQRFGDHNAVGRRLTEETDRNGAPYYQLAQEAKRRMKNPKYRIEHATIFLGNMCDCGKPAKHCKFEMDSMSRGDDVLCEAWCDDCFNPKQQYKKQKDV